MIKVLMIEDDYEIAMMLTKYLAGFDIEVESVDEPYLGLSKLETSNEYDLLILDLTLPGMDGLEVLLKVRERSNIPVIISSARDDITDKVIGLERGADDYLPKPYNPRELEARIKTVLKRKPSEAHALVKQNQKQPFIVDYDKKMITFEGHPLVLTPAEFDILSMLIERKGGAVSRENFIYESVNIDDDSSAKNIDVMVSRIRTKLSKINDKQSFIKPVRGVGYQLVDS